MLHEAEETGSHSKDLKNKKSYRMVSEYLLSQWLKYL